MKKLWVFEWNDKWNSYADGSSTPFNSLFFSFLLFLMGRKEWRKGRVDGGWSPNGINHEWTIKFMKLIWFVSEWLVTRPACFGFSFLWWVMGGTSRTAPLKEENEAKKASQLNNEWSKWMECKWVNWWRQLVWRNQLMNGNGMNERNGKPSSPAARQANNKSNKLLFMKANLWISWRRVYLFLFNFIRH